MLQLSVLCPSHVRFPVEAAEHPWVKPNTPGNYTVFSILYNTATQIYHGKQHSVILFKIEVELIMEKRLHTVKDCREPKSTADMHKVLHPQTQSTRHCLFDIIRSVTLHVRSW